jgi:hypothetical protein
MRGVTGMGFSAVALIAGGHHVLRGDDTRQWIQRIEGG